MQYVRWLGTARRHGTGLKHEEEVEETEVVAQG